MQAAIGQPRRKCGGSVWSSPRVTLDILVVHSLPLTVLEFFNVMALHSFLRATSVDIKHLAGFPARARPLAPTHQPPDQPRPPRSALIEAEPFLHGHLFLETQEDVPLGGTTLRAGLAH